jgi:peptide/nickel transport system permease protein
MTTTTSVLLSPQLGTRRKGKLRLYVCSGIVLLYILAAFFGNLVTHYSQNSINIISTLVPPGGHLTGGGIALLGTDQLGRSVLAEVVAGARDSLLIGALTLAATIVLGVVLGMLAGYYGGLVSSIIMRIVDIQMGFPPLVLAIGLAAVLGPSITTVVISLSAVYWVTIARVVRAQAMSVKKRDFVDATRVLGGRALFLMKRCIVPETITPLAVVATSQLGVIIVAAAGLSFLGLGVPANTADWGQMMANGENYLQNAWWISTMPGIALAILVIAIGFIGDDLSVRSARGGGS